MSGPATTTEVAVSAKASRRLSSTQRVLLASQLRHPRSVAQHMSLLVTFDEQIDAARFADAFDEVVRASDVLRTVIQPGDAAAAVVVPEPPARTSIHDVARGAVDRWATELAREPLDLSRCCYRSALAHHEDGTSSWLIVVHHIATDATTTAMIVDRTVDAYFGESPPASNFYDWVETLGEVGVAPTSNAAGSTGASGLGRLYGASDHAQPAATRLPVPFDGFADELRAQLESAYRLFSPELTWTAFLTTATAIYEHRLTGETDITVGVIVEHRRGENAGLAGPVMTIQPVQVTVGPDATRRELHKATARSLMSALRSADPAAPAPGGYDTIVNVITAATPAEHRIGLTNRWLHMGEIDPAHLLRVQLTAFDRDADDPELLLDIQDQVAPDGDTGVVAEHFRSVLAGMVERPDGTVGDHTLCTGDELERLRDAATAPDLPADPTPLATRLRDRLRGRDDVVVTTPDGTLTGEQLWRRVESLAADIAATSQPDDRIGIALPTSVEGLTAIYACVVAGRSFVPIDPAQPARRRRRLAERAGLVRLIEDPADGRHESAGEVTLPTVPDDDREAYLLFTSGSSGEPKGVPITRLGLARYLDVATGSYFDHVDRPIAPLFTALTFDLTITTVFTPILRGGSLVILEQTGPGALVELAAATDVNWCKATPSHLEILVQLLPADHRLATVVVGGEAFSSDLAERLLAHDPDMAIFNEYGPTEAVVGCMIHRVDPDEVRRSAAVPIGRPAPGVELRVVDGHDQPVPIGATGELLIAHAGLTSGYLDDAGAVEGNARDPFVELDGTRFYRSGDLVVYDDRLELTYLGRADAQLKVGGIRLDPLEVEQALAQHPAIERAAVRQWVPSDIPARRHCRRCGLPDNVPGVGFDDDEVCSVCHEFDRVADVADSWFRTPDDLRNELREQAARGDGRYDCMHLLSGGKDSTYALYRLVELGFRPYTLTLDNGYISEEAKANVRRVVEHLGLDHEFATTEHMTAIFRDSLATHSDVCHGCYKTIYTLATNRAVELGIPTIVTGLSRGQLFETRLIPGQFQADRFDAEAIDRAVIEARKRYHRAADLPNRLLDTTVFESDDVFDDVRYVDIYRYLDVELDEVLDFLERETPWRRPSDTGRSSNCLVNVVGIRTHQIERGYHNYAEPYAWDVRLGHKERDAAIAELDDPIEPDEIAAMLTELDYTPTPRPVLTAWVVPAESVDRAPTPTELRTFLLDRLPSHAIPTSFVTVHELPTNRNGKLDERALPPPDRRHRAAVGAQLEPESELERIVIATWESVLGVGPIGPNDDFFALGGDSLAAVTMIVELGEALGTTIPDEIGFVATTPRELATVVADTSSPAADVDDRPDGPTRRDDAHLPPPLSPGEQSILLHQHSRAGEVLYNVGRAYTVPTEIDVDRFRRATERAALRHEPLAWTYSSPRMPVDPARAVEFVVRPDPHDPAALEAATAELHRAPIDLERGPLLRCGVLGRADGGTEVVMVLHHVSGDHASLDTLWADIDNDLAGRALADLPVGYSDVSRWQESMFDRYAQFWADGPEAANPPDFGPSRSGEPDGFVAIVATVGAAELRSLARRSPVVASVAAGAVAVSPFFRGATEVNLVASTRDHPDAEPLVGYFLNPLPLTMSIDPAGPVTNAVDDAARLVGEALPRRSYPFARIAADRRHAGRRVPTGSVLVSYADDPPSTLGGLPVAQRMLWNGHSVADLSFFVEPAEETVQLALEFSGASVDPHLARTLLEAFDTSLTAIVRGADVTVGSLVAPLADHRADDAAPSILDGPALADHRTTVERTWQHIDAGGSDNAVDAADGTLTWAQLGSRAHQLANALRAAGVGRGDRVAVRVPRSKHLPVAIVGVHAVGASYVPIDPTYPSDRSRQSAEDAAVAIELSAADLAPLVGRRIVVDDEGLDGVAWDDALGAPPLPDVSTDDEAYVIFTSGSTGTPDGVAVTHGQLAASTNARATFYGHDPTRFLVVSSIAFDSSLVGIFWTFAAGGTMVVPGDDQVHDVDALVSLIDRTAPSHLLCVPTLYGALLRRRSPGGAWPEHVIVAGEACRAALIEQHEAAVPDSTLTNEYGPTETTVWATAYRCRAGDDPVPIGRPVAGTWIAVVDEHRAVVPAGTAGELVIGGAGVTNGYLGADDSPKFVDASELTGAGRTGRVFLTGDRVRLDDDELIFLGRLDDQLNVGGARVEPGDVESLLESWPGVAAAVVVATDVRPVEEILAALGPSEARAAIARAAEADDAGPALVTELRRVGDRPRLVAHLAGPDIDVSAIRKHVATRLPVTHRPAVYQCHDDLPRLPNGKIDREAVSRLAVDVTASPRVSTSEAEISLDTIIAHMSEVLLVDEITEDDSFFDLGGDSLAALELITRLEEMVGASLPMAAVHETPTARGLLARLESGGGELSAGDEDDVLVVDLKSEGVGTPVFVLHNLGINGENWRNLLEHLDDDHPWTGLGEVRGLDPYASDYDLQHDAEVEAVAARYTRTIERLHPTGPVLLVGECLGGVMAFEVAQRLGEAGREIENVVTINDWHAPDITYSDGLIQQTRRALRRADGAPIRFLISRLPSFVRYVTPRIRRHVERAFLAGFERLGLPLPARLEKRRAIEDGIQTIHHYEVRPYAGRATVIRPGDDPQLPPGTGRRGWGDRFEQYAVVYTPGQGHRLFKDPYVTDTAATFRRVFDGDVEYRPSSDLTSGSGAA